MTEILQRHLSLLGAASELIRNDGLAFLYAKPGPLPPLSPVFRRNARLGLHYEPGSFVNLSAQPRWDFVHSGFFRIYRVPRVRRVIRVIRVIHVRIEKQSLDNMNAASWEALSFGLIVIPFHILPGATGVQVIPLDFYHSLNPLGRITFLRKVLL